MANLSLTRRCQRHCAFCFARADPREPGVDMSPPTFHAALSRVQAAGIDQVRLLGGEPTLHSHFVEYVEQAQGAGLRVLVFSNGLMPEPTARFLASRDEGRITVLVNGSAGDSGPREERQWQQRTLGILGRRASLSCTMTGPGTALSGMLDVIDRHDLERTLRLGLAQPHPDGGGAWVAPRQYVAVGARIVKLAEAAAARGVRVLFDCGFVPCMFPPEFVESSLCDTERLGIACGPIPDILADGTAIACYPLASVARIEMRRYGDLGALRRALAEAARPWRTEGIFPACARCHWRQEGRCVGGCLALALHRVRGAVPGRPQVPTGSGAGMNPSPVPWGLRRTTSASSAPTPPTGSGDGQSPFTGPMGAHAANGRGSAPKPPTGRSIAVPPRTAQPSATQAASPRAESAAAARFVIPYIDQPIEFWDRLAADHASAVAEVYFPLPGSSLGSGRPPQPSAHLAAFLRHSPFPLAVVLNPIVLPRPLEAVADEILEALRRLDGEHGLKGVTVTNLLLAARVRRELPHCQVTASILMDVERPNQAQVLAGICDVLVPSGRVFRDRAALRELRRAFPGRLRLIVNEGCLPGCPLRVQHFFEMGSGQAFPCSLCGPLLAERPWLSLTGDWVLPQHLHHYDGLYDELKLAGRATLGDPQRYRRVLAAYVSRTPLLPHEIGGGPASPASAITIDEAFVERTLRCGLRCHACSYCEDYYGRHSQAATGGKAAVPPSPPR